MLNFFSFSSSRIWTGWTEKGLLKVVWWWCSIIIKDHNQWKQSMEIIIEDPDEKKSLSKIPMNINHHPRFQLLTTEALIMIISDKWSWYYRLTGNLITDMRHCDLETDICSSGRFDLLITDVQYHYIFGTVTSFTDYHNIICHGQFSGDWVAITLFARSG